MPSIKTRPASDPEAQLSCHDGRPTGRDARQRELIPPEALAKCHAVVVGVGSVGRQVALQLAAMGVPAMTLLDPDTVSQENLGCQGAMGERRAGSTGCAIEYPAKNTGALGGIVNDVIESTSVLVAFGCLIAHTNDIRDEGRDIRPLVRNGGCFVVPMCHFCITGQEGIASTNRKPISAAIVCDDQVLSRRRFFWIFPRLIA